MLRLRPSPPTTPSGLLSHQRRAAARQLLRFPPDLGSTVAAAGPAARQRRQRSRRYRQASAAETLLRLLPSRLAAALPSRTTRPHIVGTIGVIKLDGASPLRYSRYLALLGSVVLEKHPQLRTVALEVALSPEEETGGGRDAYSLSSWRVLAGAPSLRTNVLEHGLGLTVDLGTSFWNSRRGDERKRLTEDLLDFCSSRVAHQQPWQEEAESGEGLAGPVVVCDMTSGVGGLAVRLASRAAARSLARGRAGGGGADRVRVIANDWNPHAGG